MGNNLSSYHSFEGAKWGMPGLDMKNTGAPGNCYNRKILRKDS